MSACAHRHTRIYRHTFDPARAPHLVERCVDCGTNARGAGTWVPHAEVHDVEALLEDPFVVRADPRQIKLPW